MASEVHYNNPVIFDLETTDLHRDCQIIQVAALAPLSNKRFEAKIKFDVKSANPEALKINHYSKKVWKREAVSHKKARKRFHKFLEKHASLKRTSKRGNTYWVAAGMGNGVSHFDFPLIKKWFEDGDIFLPMERRVFDISQLAMWTAPDLESYSLSNLAEALGVAREGAHSAIVDCEMSADVAAQLLNQMGAWHLKWVKRRLGQIQRRRK